MEQIEGQLAPKVTPPIVLEPWRSEDIGELCAALAKVQAEIKNPQKTKTAKVKSKKGDGSSYSYNYADIADVLVEINKVAHKYGIAHSQIIMPSRSRPGKMSIITMLMHASGQWLQSEYILQEADNNHDMGGNLTYGKRYVIAPMFGIASDEDTDFKGGKKEDKEEDEEVSKKRQELEASVRAKFHKVKAGDVVTKKTSVEAPVEPSKPQEETGEIEDEKLKKPAVKRESKLKKVDPVVKSDEGLQDLLAKLADKWERPVENVTESLEALAFTMGHQEKGTLIADYPQPYVTFLLENWEKFKVKIKENLLPF